MSIPDRKGVLVALFALAAWLVTAGVVMTDLDPASRRALLLALRPQMWVLVLGLVVLVGGVWYLTRTILSDHDKAARRLATSARTAATANPRHRAEPIAKSDGLRDASQALNALADRAERAELEVDHRVRTARAEVTEERDKLAALLADMDHPLIMCSQDGLVLLLNDAARHACGREGYLGVGRSIFAVLDRDDLAGPVERVLQGERLTATVRCGSHVVQFRIGPITEAGRPTGFVLVGPPSAVPERATAGPHGDEAAAHLDKAPQRASRPVVYDFGFLELDATAPGAQDNLRTLAFTVLDTETTGLDPLRGDKIVSVGAVRVARGRVRDDDVFDRLVDPGRPIPPRATAVHGITGDMVAGRAKLADVLVDLARFTTDTVLVGHDITFDLAFLRAAEPKAGVQLPHRVLDTLLLSAVLHPADDAHDLETLAHRYGIADFGRHTALGDALVTAELLVRMIDQLDHRGITTYGEAVAASSMTRRAQEGARRF